MPQEGSSSLVTLEEHFSELDKVLARVMLVSEKRLLSNWKKFSIAGSVSKVYQVVDLEIQ
jgi:hypothetical protein